MTADRRQALVAKLLTPIGGTQARNGACAQPPCLLLQCAWNRLPLGGEEAGATAALRRILVEEKGHDRHAIRSAAYWKQGAVAHDENLEDGGNAPSAVAGTRGPDAVMQQGSLK